LGVQSIEWVLAPMTRSTHSLTPGPVPAETSFEPLWHPRDAATYLGIHEKTAIRMARTRQLPALRLGKHWRFRRVDLVSWAAAQVNSLCQPVE
jgi:excisionase family DNA binding protein